MTPPIPKSSRKTVQKNRLVFDFETDQFSDQFRHATSPDERIRYAPKLRIACVLNMASGKYSYYLPGEVDKLIARLMKADQVVSYNGKGFDIFVLQRHHRLSKENAALINNKHTDLCEEITMSAGRRCKLDELTRLNLGEKKHTDGRKMTLLDTSALKTACKSDVSQTHRIFLKWVEGSLELPQTNWRQERNEQESKDFRTEMKKILGLKRPARLSNTDLGRMLLQRIQSDIPLIHSHLPDPFPHNYIEQDTEEMTEGQIAEYLAGTWGVMDDDDLTVVTV